MRFEKEVEDFKLKVTNTYTMITARASEPEEIEREHWLHFSNLDLLIPPLDVGVFFCYDKPNCNFRNSSVNFSSMVSALKKSMAETLVTYFAFGGEVKMDRGLGVPILHCNNRGVDFVEAYADINLRDVSMYRVDKTVQGKLLPNRHNGVLAIQATEFKCGGVVVGCTFDHRIADAYSMNMFLTSWAEIAQSKPLSISPNFNRALLNPCPLAMTTMLSWNYQSSSSSSSSFNNLYIPRSSSNTMTLTPPKDHDQQPLLLPHYSTMSANDSLVSRIYHVSAHDICNLQSLANSNTNDVNNDVVQRRTKIESFSAFLWKIIAKYTANRTSSTTDKTCTLGFVVDGRMRIQEGKAKAPRDDNNNDSMANYFGNVLSIPYHSLKVNKLMESSLSEIANEVHELLKNAKTKDHFLDLIDWVEAHDRAKPKMAKVYCIEVGENKTTASSFVVSCGLRFPMLKMDFGWGKPMFGSYHLVWGGNTGYVMPMTMSCGGDWIVYMLLPKQHLDFIETEASHIIRPFTFDCLKT